MSKTWEDILNQAEENANKKFLNEMSELVKLSNDEIAECIPPDIDSNKFAELIEVVNDAAKSNREKADAIRNTAGFAEIAANLLTKL